ncbi:uncharacterized protein LOC141720128 [Apium graveolens]|uniref:uncharacterized protein LOC141720128 n=1 Tax=Apium graveolens TaxID=4045 RepID=UPI003D7AC774
MSIAAYFTKFRTIHDELECLSAKPRCSCTTCTCTINSKLEAYDQTVQLTQFLMGLNEHFTGVRGQILIMNPLPSLSQCYSVLLQEENRRESTGTVSLNKDTIAMSIRKNTYGKSYLTKTSQKSVDTSAVVCEYCHMTGHVKEKCFFLHGYPPWHRLHG